jgi:hypothetical protein
MSHHPIVTIDMSHHPIVTIDMYHHPIVTIYFDTFITLPICHTYTKSRSFRRNFHTPRMLSLTLGCKTELTCIAERRWDTAERTLRFIESLGCDLRRCFMASQCALASQKKTSKCGRGKVCLHQKLIRVSWMCIILALLCVISAPKKPLKTIRPCTHNFQTMLDVLILDAFSGFCVIKALDCGGVERIIMHRRRSLVIIMSRHHIITSSYHHVIISSRHHIITSSYHHVIIITWSSS